MHHHRMEWLLTSTILFALTGCAMENSEGNERRPQNDTQEDQGARKLAHEAACNLLYELVRGPLIVKIKITTGNVTEVGERFVTSPLQNYASELIDQKKLASAAIAPKRGSIHVWVAATEQELYTHIQHDPPRTKQLENVMKTYYAWCKSNNNEQPIPIIQDDRDGIKDGSIKN